MKSKSIFSCFAAGRETRQLKSSQSERRSDHLRKSSVNIESDYSGEIQGKAVRIVSYSHSTQSKKDKVRTLDQRSRVRIVVTDSKLSSKKSQNTMPQGELQKGAGKNGETAKAKPQKTKTNKSGRESIPGPFDEDTVACTCIPTVTRKPNTIDCEKKKNGSASGRHRMQNKIHIPSIPEAITNQQITQTVLEANEPLKNLETGKQQACHEFILVAWVFLIMLFLLASKLIAVALSILCFYSLPKLRIVAQYKVTEESNSPRK